MGKNKPTEKRNGWSRRFKDGNSRFMTRALIENGSIIMHQTERIDNPQIEVRNVVVLKIEDFKAMVKELNIFDGV